jgi:hypothetical protein
MAAASALAVPQSPGSNIITVTVVNLVAVMTRKLSSIVPCTPVSSEAVLLGSALSRSGHFQSLGSLRWVWRNLWP